MNLKIIISRYTFTKAYLSWLLMHVMFSQIVFYEYDFEKIRQISSLVLIFGGMILILFSKKEKLLLFYFSVSIVSCFSNYKYGIVDNIKALSWMAIYMFVVYPFGMELSKHTKKDIIDVFKLPILLWTISTVASLMQFVLKISFIINNKGWGWLYNRLFGVYRDPNFASVATVCVIFITLYCFQNSIGIRRFFWGIAVVFNISYVVLAFSRGTWIAGMIGIITFLYAKMHVIKHNKIRLFFSVSLFFLIVPLIIIISFDAGFLSQLTDNLAVLTHRTDLINKDISNGRVEHWRLALYAFKDNPVFGLSPRNLKVYTCQRHPELLLHEYWGDPHNGYVGVIVYTGVLGACIIFSFIFKNIAISKRVIESEYSCSGAFFLAIIVVMLIAAIFIEEVFWINSVGAIFFWISLGIINSIKNQKIG